MDTFQLFPVLMFWLSGTGKGKTTPRFGMFALLGGKNVAKASQTQAGTI
jgi:hypothetical protein